MVKLIYGRVEKRSEWARSFSKLFKKTDKDTYTLVPNSMIYQIEDPYITFINDELILGGTHPKYKRGTVETYYGYFYKGTDLEDMFYFTTGPDFMKDIRLVQLNDGRIGIFSRPRSEEVRKKYGTESIVGFTIINSIDELDDEVIENATPIEGLYKNDEWGGCNQCYVLSDRLIGVTGHQCYFDGDLPVYTCTAFVFDYIDHKIIENKIIATSKCFPEHPAKVYKTSDTSFTSGMVMRNDGLVDLYSGLGDTMEGRVTIDDPFKNYREVTKN